MVSSSWSRLILFYIDRRAETLVRPGSVADEFAWRMVVVVLARPSERRMTTPSMAAFERQKPGSGGGSWSLSFSARAGRAG